MSLEDNYELPSGFVLARADHLERVEAKCGTELIVLESTRTGEKTLVHADVVEYDGILEHPATAGLAGALTIAAALFVPIVLGYLTGIYVYAEGGSIEAFFGVSALSGVAGAKLSSAALWTTRFGEWVDRFAEWNDHKSLLVGRDHA